MSQLEIEPFVQALASDPQNLPNVKSITGYLGKASKEGHHRIYYTTDLDHYVEVAEDAIVHSERQTGNPAPTIFWILRDKPFVKSQEARQAGFLGGDISQQFLPSATTGPGGARAATTIPCGVGATLLLSCVGCNTLH